VAGRRSGFGQVRKLPSGRYRARYTIPGTRQQWVNAPRTFTTKDAAEVWLAQQRVDLEAGDGRPRPSASRVTLSDYAAQWVRTRRGAKGGPLRPATRAVYGSYLRMHIDPTIGHLALPAVTKDAVRSWFAGLPEDTPTNNARVYSFLRTVLATAVADDLIRANPCVIRGAGQATPKTEIVPATPTQVAALAEAMPEHLRLAVLLGAWCSTRAGEVLELRRKDINAETGVLAITRAVTFTYPGPKVHVGKPKTAAGVRAVAIPPHVLPEVRTHLDAWVTTDPEALLFPASPGERRHMTTGAFTWRVKQAVPAAGLPPTFRFHHLRHSGLTLAARAGATVAELQARAGHSTPHMALRYQHATTERDRALADSLSRLAAGL
jgi:integrase